MFLIVGNFSVTYRVLITSLMLAGVSLLFVDNYQRNRTTVSSNIILLYEVELPTPDIKVLNRYSKMISLLKFAEEVMGSHTVQNRPKTQ